MPSVAVYGPPDRAIVVECAICDVNRTATQNSAPSPPGPVAVFPEKVLLVMVNVPALKIVPAPLAMPAEALSKALVLFTNVESVIVTVAPLFTEIAPPCADPELPLAKVKFIRLKVEPDYAMKI